jgi:dipeptidase E
MRLYLSSHGFGNQLPRLREMVGDNKKVLFIDNAKDELPSEERQQHVAEKRSEFEAAGFDFYELDLRQYFGKQAALARIVRGAGLVWVSGGNTFILRRAMAASGLDDILTVGLRADAFVYGGSSAGAIVMTKTLRGTENGDDPYAVPTGYSPAIVWRGLGLVYPQLVPHYDSEWFGEQAQAMADYFDDNGFKYVSLRDGDVYVVDGAYEEHLS